MSQQAQPSQPAQPTLINLPQPPSNPDTPSEMPGTPTSTTTSLSALSTTAIKDGHRGHTQQTTGHRGHGHHPSTNSLEAERADRISRLTGLSGMTTLRPPHGGHHASYSAQQQQQQPQYQQSPQSQQLPLQQITPTSAAAPAAYFDHNGQPTAANKISTVGTASATDSVGARTVGEADMDEDMLSLDTNFRETEADSASGYLGGGAGDLDAMDEDLADRSVGGFEDRMSDDGEASLVGFGEGAGSTVSGPIYHRRPLPVGSSAGAMANMWILERSSSGLSDNALMGGARREAAAAAAAARGNDREGGGGGSGSGSGGGTPVSITAAMERREARMVDGVATDSPAAPDDDMFVDTTTRGPVMMAPSPYTSAIRETLHQNPQRYQQQLLQLQQLQQLQQQGQISTSASREALDRIVRGLDSGEGRQGSGGAALGSLGKGSERLGRFFFEEGK